VTVLADAGEVARAGADAFETLASEAVASRGVFRAALAGGSTPMALYRILGERGAGAGLDWSRTWLFMGDERHVPPHHADSNYGRVSAALLSSVTLPPSHVVRFEAEVDDVDAVAARYERRVREAFGLEAGELPRFDLVLLGMGADGHTASLFPGTAALRDTTRLATANWVESMGSFRFTLTPPVINAAARVVFLVTGAEKADALRDVLEGNPSPERLPAQLVCPHDGYVLWLVDRAAASKLRSSTRSSDERGPT
jgi:6-phosphogluconolactonase